MIQTIKKPIDTSKEVDFSCIKVVYKAKNGSWRGFVHPYDITIEADTERQACEALDDMTDTYEEGLKKHGYPSHLKTKLPLSDEEDREFFHRITLDALASKGEVRGSNYYARTKNKCFWCRREIDDAECISCESCAKVKNKKIPTSTYKLPGNP